MPDLGPDVWSYGVLLATLIVASVTDLRSGKIYNWLTYPAALIGLVGHSITGGLWGADDHLGLVGSLGGLAAGFGPLLVAWMAGGIGGGDAKVMGSVGALVGWKFTLTSLFYGLIVAVLMAVVIMLRKKIVRDTFGRIWRFFLLWIGRSKPDAPITEKSPTVPFGFALCIGAVIALVLTCINGPSDKLFLLGL
ncbi:MAG: prepilin peptidase [Phycisphaerae bacterium]|nr:prepilin peptidase [Phycisphaerae bacterium]